MSYNVMHTIRIIAAFQQTEHNYQTRKKKDNIKASI